MLQSISDVSAQLSVGLPRLIEIRFLERYTGPSECTSINARASGFISRREVELYTGLVSRGTCGTGIAALPACDPL